MPTQYLTVEQLAERLGVTAKTVYKWRSEGSSSPPAHKFGKYLRFSLRDVEEWEASRRETPAERGSALKFRSRRRQGTTAP